MRTLLAKLALGWVELIPFAAGMINVVAIMPRIAVLASNPKAAAAECFSSIALAAAGNAIWLYYAIRINKKSMAAMCATAVFLNLIIIGFIAADKLMAHPSGQTASAVMIGNS